MSKVNDALSDFTAAMSGGVAWGGNAYRDSPFSSYSKDGTADARHWYKHSWIARAAVDAIPDDCFKRGYQWVADSKQIAALEAVEKRHGIQRKKREALSLSRLEGEAYLYFDAGRGSPDQELRVDSVSRNGLRFVNVLRRSDITKGPIESDPMSPYFGQPSHYRVNSVSGSSVEIHPSRIIRFVNAPDVDSGEGMSVLQYLLPPIIAAETARDNVVALTTEASIDIISVCDLTDRVSTPEGAAEVARRYQLFRQGKATNKLGILDKDGEQYIQHSRQFATLPDVIEAMRREAAAAIGIPYALLFGRPAGLGTNGETELQTYYDNISTTQRNDIEPICSPLDEVVIRSALGSRPEEIHIDWLSLWEMSDKERAEVSKILADAAGVAVDKGIIPADVLTGALVNSWVEVGSFQGIDQEYQDWVSGGGVLEEPGDESDVSGRSVEGEEGEV